MGAEDFAYVLEQTPGTMLLLGVRAPGVEDPAPCHSTRMLLDEEAMPLGAALHAAIATRFLERAWSASAPRGLLDCAPFFDGARSRAWRAWISSG